VFQRKTRRNRRFGKLHSDEVQEPPGMTSKSFDWLPVDSYGESYEKAVSPFVCLFVCLLSRLLVGYLDVMLKDTVVFCLFFCFFLPWVYYIKRNLQKL